MAIRRSPKEFSDKELGEKLFKAVKES